MGHPMDFRVGNLAKSKKKQAQESLAAAMSLSDISDIDTLKHL